MMYRTIMLTIAALSTTQASAGDLPGKGRQPSQDIVAAGLAAHHGLRPVLCAEIRLGSRPRFGLFPAGILLNAPLGASEEGDAIL